jgi:hypothetical protein
MNGGCASPTYLRAEVLEDKGVCAQCDDTVAEWRRIKHLKRESDYPARLGLKA